MDDTLPSQQKTFKRNAHVKYFLRCLRALPSSAEGHDSNRITIAYFCLSALDLLGALSTETTEEQRYGWIEWIWALQTENGGFRGSTFMTTHNEMTSAGHLPSTYTAVLCLAILRADLSRLDKPTLLRFLANCQNADGSFSPIPRGANDTTMDFQSDLRMTYCAVAVSSMINDCSGINTASTISHIALCKTWEGAYASRPGVIEAQGGTTYCAIASLCLLDAETLAAEETIRWCAQRQVGGFQGRPGKLEDVCYSFWIGAALQIQQPSNLINDESNKNFLLSAQYPLGGFGKEPDDFPDPYHAYLAVAALAMTEGGIELGLQKLDCRWNISESTAEWLRSEVERTF